jgi:glutamine---fructose-6-phosphate transaminase (isomerizing)
VRLAVARFVGAYALVVMQDPNRIVVSRALASPLVIGLGIGENFVASGRACTCAGHAAVHLSRAGRLAEIIARRRTRSSDRRQSGRARGDETQWTADSRRKGAVSALHAEGDFRPAGRARQHARTAVSRRGVLESLGPRAIELLVRASRTVHIVACGTSYHAGAIGQYWIEALAGLPCSVEIASEYRYRRPSCRKARCS